MDSSDLDQVNLSVTSFDRLPNEIAVGILSELDPKDFLSLRASSHALHDLVHKHEKALVQQFIYTQQGPGFTSYTPFQDFSTMLELASRITLSASLAMILADLVVKRIGFRHTPFKKEELEGWYSRKRRRLEAKFKPAIFKLDEFYQRLRAQVYQMIRDFDELPDNDFLELGEVFDLDQQYIIAEIPADVVLDGTVTWKLLQDACMHREVSPTTAQYKIQSSVVSGGLHHLPTCLRNPPVSHPQPVPAYMELRKKLTHVSASSHKPVRTLHQLRPNPKSQDVPISRRALSVEWRFIDQQDLWSKAAFAVLQRKCSSRQHVVQPNPNVDLWLRRALREGGDPQFALRDWYMPQG